MMSWLLSLILLMGADAGAPAAPIKIEAVRRSGYALVSVVAADDKKPMKQVEFVVFSTGAAEVSFDQLGPATLVVSLPSSASVQVFAVALLGDGTLTSPSSLELSPAPSPGGSSSPPGNPAAPAAGNLRVIAVFDFTKLTEPEKALLNSQALRQGLAALGHRYLYADLNSTNFQQTLAAAKKTAPDVPAAAPFLFVEDAQRNFRAAYKLTLGPDTKSNEEAILAIFGGRK
jgi:hypothetical protein